MSQVKVCTASIRLNFQDSAKQVQIYVRPARELTGKGRFRLIQFVAGSVVDIQEDARHPGPLEIVRMLYKKRPAATPYKGFRTRSLEPPEFHREVLETRYADILHALLEAHAPGGAHRALPADSTSFPETPFAIRQFGAVGKQQYGRFFAHYLGKRAVRDGYQVAVLKGEPIPGYGDLLKRLFDRSAEILMRHAGSDYPSRTEKIGDDISNVIEIQRGAPQLRFQVGKRPRRKRQEISRDKNIL
jgi:hypothetical protein